MRVFVDTNIWFSGFYGSVNCRKILKLQAIGKIRAVLSRTVVNELTKNLGEKFPLGLKLMAEYLSQYPPEMVDDRNLPDRNLGKLVHPKDEIILNAAIEANCDYLVTGNLRDFKVKEIEKEWGIRVVGAEEVIST